MGTLFHIRKGYGNVVLNFSDPREEFGILAKAYHEAAEALVQNLRSNGGYRDFEACPIVFLYRHSLELYLKAIVIKGADLLNLLTDDSIDYLAFFRKHQLKPLLPPVQQIWRLMGWNWDFGIDYVREFEGFRNIVEEIEEVDPQSFSFRYPVDKSMRDAIPKHFHFNLIAFAECLNPLLRNLDGALTGIEDRWDHAAEIVFEAEQLLKNALR